MRVLQAMKQKINSQYESLLSALYSLASHHGPTRSRDLPLAGCAVKKLSFCFTKNERDLNCFSILEKGYFVLHTCTLIRNDTNTPLHENR